VVQLPLMKDVGTAIPAAEPDESCRQPDS